MSLLCSTVTSNAVSSGTLDAPKKQEKNLNNTVSSSSVFKAGDDMVLKEQYSLDEANRITKKELEKLKQRRDEINNSLKDKKSKRASMVGNRNKKWALGIGTGLAVTGVGLLLFPPLGALVGGLAGGALVTALAGGMKSDAASPEVKEIDQEISALEQELTECNNRIKEYQQKIDNDLVSQGIWN